MMPQPLRSLVPMIHVRDIARSLEFYGMLGFSVNNTFVPEGGEAPTWAWLISGGAHLMLAQADESASGGQQGTLFYVYCDDVTATHAELEQAGIRAGAISCPFYAPRGEFRVEDPDGYVLMVTHT